MTEERRREPSSAEDPPAEDDRPMQLNLEKMLIQLSVATGEDFAAYESDYNRFITGAQSSIQSTPLYDYLLDLHGDLQDQFIGGKIQAVQSWANGESEFRVSPKSWSSLIDKLFRINIEENINYPKPPVILSVAESAQRELSTPGRSLIAPANFEWVTPARSHLFADDLVRTKVVVPFIDGVVDVSAQIKEFALKSGYAFYRRYHAKDSGYHARHMYVLVDVPTVAGGDSKVAFEIKILTKLQDTLGELTHLLYELKRTGRVASMKKRKLAWEVGSEDFKASYIGHSAHYLEAEILTLKTALEKLGEEG